MIARALTLLWARALTLLSARALTLLSALAAASLAAAHTGDTDLSRAFREMRAAEMAQTGAPLSDTLAAAASRVPGRAATERAELARTAVAGRQAARTSAELRSVERSIAARRVALARSIEATAPDAATELLLEAAEDLLLREFAADGSDAMLAVGLPTEAERGLARETLARADALLGDPAIANALADASALATDPIAFRSNFLAGLAQGSRADLEECEGRDASASRASALLRLDRAARSELPAPAEIAAILSLARARSTVDRAARAPLLADAAKSQDETRAFMARIEQWRDRADGTAFPTAPAGLEALATTAECRLRAARAADAEAADRAIGATIERVLRADPAQSMRMAAILAPRVDARLIQAASGPAAAPSLLALAAVAGSDRAFMRERLELLIPLVDDPAIGAFLAVPLARELQSNGRTLDAARVLTTAAASTAAADARDVLDIALDLSRHEADRSASGEVAFDRALDVASTRLASDPRRPAWLLQRVDLALFPRFTKANADRAAQLLLSVPTDAALRPARDLRAAEVDGARAAGDADAALAVIRKAEFIGTTLGRTDGELAARAEILRTNMLLVARRPAEALTCAALALRERGLSDHTARRACEAWMRAAIAQDDSIAPPDELLAFAARFPEIAEAALPLITSLSEATDEALLRDDRTEARRIAEQRLGPLVRISQATPAPAAAAVARAAVLAELGAAHADRALEIAERSVKRWPSDRALLWLRAEACRALSAQDEAMRARTFAHFKELSPLATRERDAYWWRAQLEQLEMLADDAAQRETVLARVNRLGALDGSLGGPALARRFEGLRARCAPAGNGANR